MQKIILLLLLITPLLTFSQNCNTILTVMDQNELTVYYTYEVNGSGGFVGSSGCAPTGIPVIVKLNKLCSDGETCSSYYFNSSDLNGNYDALILTYNNKKFLTQFATFAAGQTAIAEGKSCFAHFEIPIPICDPDGGDDNPDPDIDPCVFAGIQECCGFYCVRINRNLNGGGGCLGQKCYKVHVKFTDGAETFFNIDFNNGNSIMKCFSKEVDYIISVKPILCANANTVGATKQEKESDNNIILYPNPANSQISYIGNNLKNYSLVIVNKNNNIVLETDKLNNIDISNLREGVYFCKLIYRQNGLTVQIDKIIKN